MNIEEAIREAFAGYREAVLAEDGDSAYSFVNARTRTEYDRFVRLANNATAEETRGLGLMDAMQVVILRHVAGSPSVRTMSGRDFFVFAVDNGYISRSSVEKMGLGEIIVTGDTAKAIGTLDDRPTKITLDFSREESGWKVDIMSAAAPGEAALRLIQESSGSDCIEFSAELAERLTGDPVDMDKIVLPASECDDYH